MWKCPRTARRMREGKCDERVRRGGAWSDVPVPLRSGKRGTRSRSPGGPDIGFRVVRDLPVAGAGLSVCCALRPRWTIALPVRAGAPPRRRGRDRPPRRGSRGDHARHADLSHPVERPCSATALRHHGLFLPGDEHAVAAGAGHGVDAHRDRLLPSTRATTSSPRSAGTSPSSPSISGASGLSTGLAAGSGALPDLQAAARRVPGIDDGQIAEIDQGRRLVRSGARRAPGRAGHAGRRACTSTARDGREVRIDERLVGPSRARAKSLVGEVGAFLTAAPATASVSCEGLDVRDRHRPHQAQVTPPRLDPDPRLGRAPGHRRGAGPQARRRERQPASGGRRRRVTRAAALLSRQIVS